MKTFSRRKFLQYGGSGLAGKFIIPTALLSSLGTPALTQTATDVVVGAAGVGSLVGNLLGLDNTDDQITQEYLQRIQANQKLIIDAIAEVSSQISSLAVILAAIPAQTNETAKLIAADGVLVRAFSLEVTVIETTLAGDDPVTDITRERYLSLLTDLEQTSSEYPGLLRRVGQSQDLCVSIHALWQATQSAARTGVRLGLFDVGERGLLRSVASNIRDSVATVLNGEGGGQVEVAGTNAQGNFRLFQAAATAELSEGTRTLQSFSGQAIANAHYYLVDIDPDFYTAPAPLEVVGGTVNIYNTAKMTGSCGLEWMDSIDGVDGSVNRPNRGMFPNCGVVLDVVISRFSSEFTLKKEPLDPLKGAANNFKLSIDPVRDGTTFLRLIQQFNAAKAKEFMYDSVVRLLSEVVEEVELKSNEWI